MTAKASESCHEGIGDFMSEEHADAVGPDFSPAWRTVSFGTSCLSIGAILLFAGMMVLPIMAAFNAKVRGDPFAAVGDQRPVTLWLTEFLILGCLLIVLFGAMLWLAGLCLSCLTPPESGARPMAVA